MRKEDGVIAKVTLGSKVIRNQDDGLTKTRPTVKATKMLRLEDLWKPIKVIQKVEYKKFDPVQYPDQNNLFKDSIDGIEKSKEETENMALPIPPQLETNLDAAGHQENVNEEGEMDEDGKQIEFPERAIKSANDEQFAFVHSQKLKNARLQPPAQMPNSESKAMVNHHKRPMRRKVLINEPDGILKVRPGYGEQGEGVYLEGAEKTEGDKSVKNHSFNVFISNMISLKRTIPDTRDEE